MALESSWEFKVNVFVNAYNALNIGKSPKFHIIGKIIQIEIFDYCLTTMFNMLQLMPFSRETCDTILPQNWEFLRNIY